MRSLSKAPNQDEQARSEYIRNTVKTYKDNMRKTDIFSSLHENLTEMHPNQRKEIFNALAKSASVSATSPKKIPEGIKNAPYYELITNFHEDVKCNIAPLYLTKAFDNLIVPYVNANPFVFENYLVYVIVASMFLEDAEDFSKAYAGFAGEFLSMLTFTAALFYENKSLSDDEMIIGMYLYHRKISHNKELRKNLAAAFSNNLFNMLLGALGGIN
jgi:hypothetical protein